MGIISRQSRDRSGAFLQVQLFSHGHYVKNKTSYQQMLLMSSTVSPSTPPGGTGRRRQQDHNHTWCGSQCSPDVTVQSFSQSISGIPVTTDTHELRFLTALKRENSFVLVVVREPHGIRRLNLTKVRAGRKDVAKLQTDSMMST